MRAGTGCHGDNLLGLRLALIQKRISAALFEAIIGYRSPTPLFGTGTAAAEYGQRDIANPGPTAIQAMGKIIRRRTDLR